MNDDVIQGLAPAALILGLASSCLLLTAACHDDDTRPAPATTPAVTPASAGSTSTRIGGAALAGTGAAPLAGRGAQPVQPVDTKSMPYVSTEIAAVGFDQSNKQQPLPLLLYKGGYASFNVDLVVRPIDIAYDVVEHPLDWPQWRRTPTGLERKVKDEWKPLQYEFECKALPPNSRVNGLFERYVANIVDPSIGGVATRTRYSFRPDGTFASCEAKTTILVTAGSRRNEQTPHTGTYTIDGFTLRLNYQEGGGASFPFFYDPARPTRVWIEKGYYPTTSEKPTELCVLP
jgi:hypothetical protein